MNKIQIVIAMFIILSSAAVNLNVSSAGWVATNDPDSNVFQKAELPVGGVWVTEAKNKQVLYYFLGEWKIRKETSNAGKSAGLYGSTNGGQTWKLLTNYFEFKTVFVHPTSGELFAIIQDNIIAPRENGFLTVQYFDKAISSKNGIHWKDIMGKKQRASGLMEIIADPEQPNRVRLGGHAFRFYELIAIDDNYSDWKRVVKPSGTMF